MRNKIKQLFEEAKVPMDDRHKFLYRKLVDLFEELTQSELKGTIEEGFELVHIYTQKRVSLTDGELWEVKEYNETFGKEYKTLARAIKSASE